MHYALGVRIAKQQKPNQIVRITKSKAHMRRASCVYVFAHYEDFRKSEFTVKIAIDAFNFVPIIQDAIVQ